MKLVYLALIIIMRYYKLRPLGPHSTLLHRGAFTLKPYEDVATVGEVIKQAILTAIYL
jgi:hypothetical protein